jgi:CheY-like chemotaxis protein
MGTILIVDDEPEIRKLFRTALGRLGHEIVTAANGADALLALGSCWPDLLLLDLAMPEMDGISFLRLIRRTPEWAKLPVIVLTAFTTREQIKSVLDLDVADHLTKAEFTIRELRARIAKHLPPAKEAVLAEAKASSPLPATAPGAVALPEVA